MLKNSLMIIVLGLMAISMSDPSTAAGFSRKKFFECMPHYELKNLPKYCMKKYPDSFTGKVVIREEKKGCPQAARPYATYCKVKIF